MFVKTQVIIEKNVPCTMRDGTVLMADIYRPAEDGKYPVLLTRLPYSKDNPHYTQRFLDPIRAATQGYVVIIQDVRGRFRSDGTFEPHKTEEQDGYDTVEWAAALPYSNGKVGMYGLSYYGYTQLQAAVAKPPHLICIVPALTYNDLRDGVVAHGGATELAMSESWTLGTIVPDLLIRKHGHTLELATAFVRLAGQINRFEQWYQYAPVNEWPPLKELGVAEYFFDQLQTSFLDPIWEEVNVSHRFESIEVPAYHLAGWYDCFLGPTIKNFTELRKRAGTERARNGQKLIIGPWGHGVFTPVLGERSFGIHASGDWIELRGDTTSLHLRWFDHWLKGIDNKIMEEAPIKIFVMGINEWRDEWEWPLARTQYIPFYFHSDGHANTRYGDGSLKLTAPTGQEPPDTFVYDPANPVPTCGGGTLYAGIMTMGPRDQRRIEERDDVLVYTSEPLKEPLEVTGPIQVKLYASTSAVDTDFTAKLVDVQPDGTAYNLTDGIIRARYRHGYEEHFVTPGEIVEYTIDLWATSNVFLPGHRIRVEISSSNFPRFDRNPNTGNTLLNSAEMVPATQVIYHDASHPSHILLPVIPSKTQ
jgi:putative CocE/NonD family hydrolase